MRKPMVSVGLVALALVPFATLAAQEQPPPLEPGARVRVTAPNLGVEKQQATFRALRGDTLVVTADSTVYCPLGHVERLDVYQGRTSHPWRGAAIGAAVGGTAGFITGVALGGGCIDSNCFTGAQVGGILAVAGGVVGGLIGLGVGSAIKTDRWDEVPLDQFRVSFVPRPDGLALSMSVAF
jgi:hypothetical protein